jgi:hypothetical protein
MAHFATVLVVPPSWAPSTVFAGFTACIPSPPNGYFFVTSGGTSGLVQPTWPLAVAATVGPDGTIALWENFGTLEGYFLGQWDAEQAATINGDLGGTWTPSSPITFLTGGGGVVQVQGPMQVTNNGILLVSTGATIPLAAGDYPINGTDHLGHFRRIVTACELGIANAALAVRADYLLNALDVVCCSVAYYTAALDDSSVTVSTIPVQWTLPLDVHNTGTLTDVVLTYRAVLGTPKARIVAIPPSGVAIPLTSAANGADANGYVDPPAIVTTETVQSWTIPIDGGSSPANAVMSRDGYTYELQVLEDASQTDFPAVLPVLSPVIVATTGPIDMANAPTTIDGVTMTVGQRVLIKDQFNPDENGIYIYPGAGNPFPVASATPVPYWLTTTAYAVGALVQPNGFIPGHGLYFKATAIAGTGTSSGRQPTWPIATGGTVIDNPGPNQITWTCQGPLDPYIYSPSVELRTYGLLQGSTVLVLEGSANNDTVWQYTGGTIEPGDLGSTPAIGWVTIPGGFLPATTAYVPQEGVGVFSAQGNAYHQAACDFANILTQAFQ